MKKSIIRLCLVMITVLLQSAIFAQLKLGANPARINKSSILELDSRDQGLLLTRIPDTTLATLAGAPDGTIIYFTADQSLRLRKNGGWQKMADAANFWQLGGSAGGDLTGAYPNPAIAAGAVTNGKLANGSVTYNKVQNLSANNVLLGRYNNGPGAMQEITLGAGLTLNNATGVLTAAGSGGTVTNVSASVPTGFSVAVTNPATTPAIAITTALNGPVRGNGTGFATGPTVLSSEVSGTLPFGNGGTGLSTLGTANQLLRVNAAANALEYFTPAFLTTIDTSNIALFYRKVRGLLSAGTGISYNNATGAISNSGVTSVNGNIGALTIDTGYIATFSQKTRSLFSAGAGISYNNATGAISNTGVTSVNGNTGAINIDTGYISSFSQKVRSLFSAGTGITYNATTGAISSSATGATNLTSSVTNYNVTVNSSSGTGTTFAIPKDSLSRHADATITTPVSGQLLQYNGSKWVNFTPNYLTSGNVWTLGGNGVTSAQAFGTTTNFSLPFITNNTERMRITASGDVGIGVTDPTNPLVVSDTLEIRQTNTAAQLSQLIFTNVSGSGGGDFRIGSDGNDIFWQGGGGRNLQMGSFWGITLAGDRQLSNFPAYVNGTGGTGVLIPSQRAVSVPLAIQANAASQTANLTEWRGGDGTVLSGISPTGNLGIGSMSFDATNPEKVLIDAGVTSSVNAMYLKGTINSYFQLNIRNNSTGGQASADIVATANNGTESTNFVDLGINNSGYTYQNGNPIETGKANDGYLLSAGNDFYLVNNNASKDLIVLTGGTATTNEAMRVTAARRVGLGTSAPAAKLDVAGTFKLGTSGTALNNMFKTSVTITDNTTSITSTASVSKTVTVTGATTQSSVIINPRSALPSGLAIAYAFVSAANTVTVNFINSGAGPFGILNLGTVTFDITIIQ